MNIFREFVGGVNKHWKFSEDGLGVVSLNYLGDNRSACYSAVV